MKRLVRHFIKRGEVGQSIIILAIGFIGLLAVVGITTDVSLMFVRYSSLRRAVDSAAIAAAGQMRQDRSIATVELTARQYIEFHGLNPRRVEVRTCAMLPEADRPLPENEDICTEDQRKLVRVRAEVDSPTVFLRLLGFADVRLTASAISETAVLDVVIIMDVSESMLSETGYEDWAQVGLGVAYVPPRLEPGAANFEPPENRVDLETVYTELVDLPDPNDRGVFPIDEPFYTATGEVYFDDLNPPATAGIDPTDLTWTFPDPATIDYSDDEFVNFWNWRNWFWREYILGVPQASVNNRLYYLPAEQYLGNPVPNVPGSLPNNINSDGTQGNAPTLDAAGQHSVYYPVRSFVPNYNNWTDVFPDQDELVIWQDPGSSLNYGQAHPRNECRVRFFANASAMTLDQYAPDGYLEGLYTRAGNTWPADADGKFSGFVPTFNFYGCCNDPTNGSLTPSSGTVNEDGVITPGLDGSGSVNNGADGDFSDLVCQPFKQAKDATRQFLSRIDFLRGDRVAFVTFDRSAFLIDPDGDGNSPHMIEDYVTAVNTLNQNLGVRAEPNFYVWNQADGGWSHPVGDYNDGPSDVTVFAQGIFEDGRSIPIYYEAESNADIPTNLDPALAISPVDYNDYPVKDNCQFWNATLGFPRSRYADHTAPAGEQSALAYVMNPPIFNAEPWITWRRLLPNGNAAPNAAFYITPESNAYELRAQCRGTNMGAALRSANAALTDPDTQRREGTVWIMIMLSDGAAGASDPVRSVADKINPARPYLDTPQGGDGYGSYGLCPYGVPDHPSFSGLGELVVDRANDQGPPYCADKEFYTRHFCTATNGTGIGQPLSVPWTGGGFDTGFMPNGLDSDYDPSLGPAENLAAGNVYDLDIGVYGQAGSNCHPLYDVDDYARDWADFVAGIARQDWCVWDSNRCGAGQADDSVLPTIFTIGFGLNFNNGRVGDDPGTCDDNVEDCRGEELLRYIADAGDNFQIDSDYQQALLADPVNNIAGQLADALNGAYGPADPCQPDNRGWDWTLPTDPPETRTGTENCGNYYNAPNQAELEAVFDDIASRMFTRLAG